jgi:hypothetical protein
MLKLFYSFFLIAFGHSQIFVLKPSMATLATTFLNVKSNNELPSDDFAAYPNLRILFLSGRGLDRPPRGVAALSHLFMLSLKNNRLADADAVVVNPALGWLILTNNAIPQLPATFGRMTRLRKLMLSGNRLTSLPSSLKDCVHLELVRLANNCMSEYPEVLFELPNLRWVALAGNPCCPLPKLGPVDKGLVKQFSHANSELVEKIGKGASGDVWALRCGEADYALKLYTSQAVGSDGAPVNELHMLAHGRTHPGLVPLAGVWIGEDGQIGGVVLQRLRGFSAIGQPPNFDTVTRDVYPARFSRAEAERYVAEVTATLAALHGRQLIHGDVYSHNVLAAQQTLAGATPPHALLSDLGATFWVEDSAMFARFQAIELRALALFREEVMGNITK